MYRNHKAVSIMMALVFCLSMLAPVFVAPQAADALATGSAITIPNVRSAANQQLGTVVVQDAGSALSNATIQCILPSGVEYTGDPAVVYALPVALSNTVYGSVPDYIGGKINILTASTSSVRIMPGSSKKMLVLSITQTSWTADNQVAGFALAFTAGTNAAVTISTVGDILMSFQSPTNSVSPGLTVLNGKVIQSGSINTALDKLNVAAGSNKRLGSIQIMENVRGALQTGTTFDVVLPDGVTFNGNPHVTTSNPFQVITVSDPGDTAAGLDRRRFEVTTIDPTYAAAGFFIIDQINVDVQESMANGDIIAQVRSVSPAAANAATAGTVSDSDLTIGYKGDYSISITASEPPVINNGLWDAKIASIFIKEAIGATLVTGRTITLELPENAMWTSIPSVTVKSGGMTVAAPAATVVNTNNRKLSYTVTTASQVATEIEFKNGAIGLEADGPVGDVSVAVSGSAVPNEGSVVVAKAQAPVSATCDPVNDVIIGLQNQAGSDILVTETKAGSVTKVISGTTAHLVFRLPDGVDWAAKPTFEVTEGDLVLDTLNVWRSGSFVTVPVKTASTIASTITISGIVYTTDRTVPEGPVELQIAGFGLDRTTYFKNMPPFAAVANPQNENTETRTAQTVIVANCVTPAPTETLTEYTGSFTLGSTIYYVNGMAKIMDVAPFAMDGRVLVPQRYLGIALGIPNDDTHIIWDQATQTATFVTVDGKEATCTIGSKVLTFDGVETQMDVEPQVVDGRIFLPARFLTEAMGGTVGWDGVTQTALVNIAI